MTIWVENSKVIEHGGANWEFGKCLWAPTKQKNGSEAYHHAHVGEIKAGDLVIHLRPAANGKPSQLYGYSLAINDGYVTRQAPEQKGAWQYSDKFFRVDLSGIIEFKNRIFTKTFFAQNETFLREHRQNHKRLFYSVGKQGRGLAIGQGYCFKATEEIWKIIQKETDTPELLSSESPSSTSEEQEVDQIVHEIILTREKTTLARQRVGHQLLASRAKKAYGNSCCISACQMDDPSFMVASHIARWSDNPEARGLISNILCLCVFHDRAFENGYFYVNNDLTISINDKKSLAYPGLLDQLEPLSKATINPISDEIRPDSRFLEEHRKRIGVSS